MKYFALRCLIAFITCGITTYVLDIWILKRPDLFLVTFGVAFVLTVIASIIFNKGKNK